MTAIYDTAHTSSGATVLTGTGHFTWGPAVDDLRQQLRSLVEAGATRVVVDLSSVDSVDSSGIAALIFGMKLARAEGGDLRIASPNALVTAALKGTHLTSILVAYDSPEDAFPAEA